MIARRVLVYGLALLFATFGLQGVLAGYWTGPVLIVCAMVMSLANTAAIFLYPRR
jgi:hypothetical protein